jgi:hypothetical protein
MSVLCTLRPAIPDGECRVDHRRTTRARPSGSARTATRPPACRLEAPQRVGHAGNVRRPRPCRHWAYALRPLRRLGPAHLERPNVDARATPRGTSGQPVLPSNDGSAAATDNVGRSLKNHDSRLPPSRLSAQPPSPSCTGPKRPSALSPAGALFFWLAATSPAGKTTDLARFLAILSLSSTSWCKAGLGRRCDRCFGSSG